MPGRLQRVPASTLSRAPCHRLAAHPDGPELAEERKAEDSSGARIFLLRAGSLALAAPHQSPLGLLVSSPPLFFLRADESVEVGPVEKQTLP